MPRPKVYFVSAPDIDQASVEALEATIKNSLDNPDYAVVVNYEMTMRAIPMDQVNNYVYSILGATPGELQAFAERLEEVEEDIVVTPSEKFIVPPT